MSARDQRPAVAPVVRIPPHSAEAEQHLIGALLLDNRAWDRVADVVRPSDFYRDDHRRIFGHIVRLIDAGQPADVVTVGEAIERSNEVDQTGGSAYLAEIAYNVASSANVRRYAEIVADRAMCRALLTAGVEIQALAESPGTREAEARVDEAMAKMMALAEARPSDSEPELVGAVLGAVVDEIQELYDSDAEVAGTATGFADLDRKTTGMREGDLIIVGGRPAMGKTAFVLNIAEHVGIECGLPVAVFSMEMTKPQLARRLIASIGRIDGTRLRTGKLIDDDWDKMAVALQRLHQSKLVIDDTSGLTVARMRARARRIKRQQGGLGLVVIDYLQLLEAPKDGENRNAELTAISRGLKAMAKELRVPVIALSQLSRKVEERTEKRPLLSDLRESGAIEQDADMIWLLYRDEYYKPDTQFKGIAEVHIEKQRDGPTGQVNLAFHGHHTRFANLLHGQMPEAAPAERKGKGYKP